jgi:hypothetical protein
MSDTREVFGLYLPGEIYRDQQALAEDDGRSLQERVVYILGQNCKASSARLERIARDKAKAEQQAMEAAQRAHDEAVVYGAHPESSAPNVVAARERLSNG